MRIASGILYVESTNKGTIIPIELNRVVFIETLWGRGSFIYTADKQFVRDLSTLSKVKKVTDSRFISVEDYRHNGLFLNPEYLDLENAFPQEYRGEFFAGYTTGCWEHIQLSFKKLETDKPMADFDHTVSRWMDLAVIKKEVHKHIKRNHIVNHTVKYLPEIRVSDKKHVSFDEFFKQTTLIETEDALESFSDDEHCRVTKVQKCLKDYITVAFPVCVSINSNQVNAHYVYVNPKKIDVPEFWLDSTSQLYNTDNIIKTPRGKYHIDFKKIDLIYKAVTETHPEQIKINMVQVRNKFFNLETAFELIMSNDAYSKSGYLANSDLDESPMFTCPDKLIERIKSLGYITIKQQAGNDSLGNTRSKGEVWYINPGALNRELLDIRFYEQGKPFYYLGSSQKISELTIDEDCRNQVIKLLNKEER